MAFLYFQNISTGVKKRRCTRPIDSFFGKLSKQSTQTGVVGAPPMPSTSSAMDVFSNSENYLTTKSVSPVGTEAGSSHPVLKGVAHTKIKDITSNLAGELVTHDYDIGLYVGKSVDKFTKFGLLQHHWEPPKDYSFPFSVHNKNGKFVKRFLGRNHLESKHWLVFSDIQKGLYCKYCVLFAHEYCGHNKGVHLQSLVTKSVTSFAKLLGRDGCLETHERNAYHRESVEAGKNFIKTYTSPEEAVVNKVITQRLQQVQENRERLRPIIESIIFLGRQNIPLRGHRDDGNLHLQEDPSPVNEGNFRELLRFRISSGDHILKKHLDNSSARATYIGKNTQNSLIECCGKEITRVILNRVRQSGCFSILFDETTDISHTEQLSLTLRYVYNGFIREDFITFIDAYDAIQDKEGNENGVQLERKLTGEVLGKIVVNIVKELLLDVNNCVGIGTDSCSVMSSELVGAVCEIRREATHACWCPCLNHALNNSLSKSNNVASVRNSIGIMKSVTSFFNMSAKRNGVLRKFLEKRNDDLGMFLGKQLPGLCETRWVERHDTVLKFREALPYLIEALESISGWTDLTTSSNATALITSLCDVQFISAMISLIDVLKHTLPLSRRLQTPSLDLRKASDAIQDTLSVLKKKRQKCDETFSEVFCEVKELCSQLGVEIKLPRVTARQQHRPNYTSNTPEEYYKKSTYIPLLDNVIADLISRFPKDSLDCFGLRVLIPTVVVKDNPKDGASDVHKDLDEENMQLQNLIDKFAPILGLRKSDGYLVNSEFELWREKWERENRYKGKLPATAIEAMDACDKDMFPSIYSLLKILATLPVSVASAERTFSTLRRLKTWQRARMGEERLSGLCLLHTHRDIEIDVDSVIERFANSGNRRRIDFVV